MADFADALEENPAPRRPGDVRPGQEPGRPLGESLPPTFRRRQLPFLYRVWVEHLGASEGEALFRVWRLPPDAFGLRGAGLA